MFLFAGKIIIPFVVYGHPAPWIFLVGAVLAWGLGLRKFYQGGPVQGQLGWPAVLFCYAGYHAVGGATNGFDPAFLLGTLGCAGSTLYTYHVVRSDYDEEVRLEKERPQREAEQRRQGINSIVAALSCSPSEAESLMDCYNGDDTKAIMEVRAGRASLSRSDQPPRGPAGALAEAPPRVEGSPFDSDGYVLLLLSPGPKDYAHLGRLLASVTTLTAIDATQQLKAHRGAILLPHLRSEVADAFMKLLQDEGQEVLKMPMRDMLTFSFAGDVKSLQYQEQALIVHTTTGEEVAVPWDQMVVLSVALFAAQVVSDPQGLVDIRKGILCGDLFALQGQQCYQFAIDAKRLTYAHLGARMQSTAVANFVETVRDIVERAPNLLKNDSVDPLLAKGMARSYKSPEDFAGESTGLLQLIQAHRV